MEQVQEAIDAGADIIMLDNMDNETMKKAVALIDGRAETECSGNVTAERVKDIIETGVDYMSCGALTHSSAIMDISLKNLHAI
jgi:nicotinate-nucleotide pyrophosphorylase (carboxylating)